MRNNADQTEEKNTDMEEPSHAEEGEVYGHAEAITWNSRSTAKEIDTT